MTKTDHNGDLKLSAIDAHLNHWVSVIFTFAVRANTGVFSLDTVDLALRLKFENFLVDT